MADDQRTVLVGGSLEEQQFYESLVAQFGTPLLVYDSQVLEKQYQLLSQALPGVGLFYAVKAHPDEEIVRTIDSLGGGFDVASAGETDLLMDLKVFGRRTIHTHPIKKDNEIRTALRFGVTTFVVDNLHELKKLVPYRQRVGVLLRVSFRSPNAIVDLSKKFGCAVEDAPELIRQARQMGVHIKGLSFHVGSQCSDASQHVSAIEKCREVMLQMADVDSIPMSVLDIGGGFPADYKLAGFDIGMFCKPIREALATLPADWNVIAEPGRYLIAPAVTSVTTVIGKSIRGPARWYYLDDGVYGSYSGQIFDHACYPLQVLREGELHLSVLAGPTCDSIDIVAEEVMIPELEPGDLIIGHQMGAYTAATRTRFNSLPDAKMIYLRNTN